MSTKSQSLLEEAAAWVEWSQRPGRPDPHAAADFENWMAQSEGHRRAYADLYSLWRSDALAEAAAAAAERPRHRWLRSPAAWAPAGLALAAGVVTVMFAPLLQSATFSTPRGAPQVFRLADGSTAHLSGGAQIEVRQGLLGRAVRLESGEAFFDVRHDGRPFRVSTPEARVRVLGTAFNVDRLPSGRVEVSVYRGAVSFGAPGRPAARLGPGEQGVMERGRLVRVGRADVGDEPDWMSGWYDASDASLGRLIQELDRYSELPIEIAEPDVAARRISGRFHVVEPDRVLALIETAYAVEAVRHDDRIVIADAASP